MQPWGPNHSASPGLPSKAGLRVSFPGMRLKLGSWRKDSLTGEGILWKTGLIKSSPEHHLMCWHEQKKAWYRMTGFYQDRVVNYWSDKGANECTSSTHIRCTLPLGRVRSR